MDVSHLALFAGLPLFAWACLVGARRPVALLALYAGLVPFGSAITIPGLPGPFGTLSTVFGLLVAGVLVIHLALGGRRVRELAAPVPAWVLLVVSAVLTIGWSIDPATTAEDSWVLLSLVALFAVGSLLDVTPADVRTIGTVSLLSGAGVGLVAVGQLATGTMFTDPGTGMMRLAFAGGGGDVPDPNITAAGLMLPLAVGLFRAVEPAREWRLRVLEGAACALIVFAVLLTGSRGGLLALLAIGVLLVYRDPTRRPRMRSILATGLLGLAGLAALAGQIQDRVLDASSTGRTDIWLIGLASCPEHCLQGSGWGTFSLVHAEGLLTSPQRTGWMFGYGPHNVWLQVLVQVGIIGFVLFMVASWLSYRELLRLPLPWRTTPIAALTGLLAANVFVANLDFKYFWLTLLYVVLCINAAEHLPPASASEATSTVLSSRSGGPT